METARKDLRQAQERYRRHFDRGVRAPVKDISLEYLVFVNKEYFRQTKHKFSTLADGPYGVTGVTLTTVTLKMGDMRQRLARDQVVKAP